MIFIANAENRWPFENDLAEMHLQRKSIFIDLAGWKLPVVADLEIDGYDRQDTMHLLAKDVADGPSLASVRSLPTLGPHLMSGLFSQACPEGIRHRPTTWELSRFCTAPNIRSRGKRLSLLWEVICGVMETALLYGIEQVIFAATRPLLPLALACGWEARILGPTLCDDNDDVTPVAAAVTPHGLRLVRDPLSSQGIVIFDRLPSEDAVDHLCGWLESWFGATARCDGDSCTRSQCDGLSQELKVTEATVAEMPCASALAYLGSITQCVRANRTDHPRTGLIVSYSLGWLRPVRECFPGLSARCREAVFLGPIRPDQIRILDPTWEDTPGTGRIDGFGKRPRTVCKRSILSSPSPRANCTTSTAANVKTVLNEFFRAVMHRHSHRWPLVSL